MADEVGPVPLHRWPVGRQRVGGRRPVDIVHFAGVLGRLAAAGRAVAELVAPHPWIGRCHAAGQPAGRAAEPQVGHHLGGDGAERIVHARRAVQGLRGGGPVAERCGDQRRAGGRRTVGAQFLGVAADQDVDIAAGVAGVASRQHVAVDILLFPRKTRIDAGRDRQIFRCLGNRGGGQGAQRGQACRTARQAQAVEQFVAHRLAVGGRARRPRRGRLQDGAAKQAPGQRCVREEQGVGGASRVAADGDVGGIAAKRGNVGLHPAQGGDLVEQAVVGRRGVRILAAQGIEPQEAESAQPVLQLDHDDTLAVQAVVGQAAGAGSRIGAAVDIYQHRQPRIRLQRRRAQRNAQAVFLRAGDETLVPADIGLHAGGGRCGGIQHARPRCTRRGGQPAPGAGRGGGIGYAIEDRAAVGHGGTEDLAAGHSDRGGDLRLQLLLPRWRIRLRQRQRYRQPQRQQASDDFFVRHGALSCLSTRRVNRSENSIKAMENHAAEQAILPG